MTTMLTVKKGRKSISISKMDPPRCHLCGEPPEFQVTYRDPERPGPQIGPVRMPTSNAQCCLKHLEETFRWVLQHADVDLPDQPEESPGGSHEG